MNRFLFLMIFIILVVAGWSGAWIYGSKRINTEVESYFASTANSAQKVDCEQFVVAGFPFRFDITCTNLSINNQDVRLQIPEIQVSVLAYRPTHALVFAIGPAIIEDSFSGSKRQVNWQGLKASIRTNGWALARISIEGTNIELIDNVLGQTLIASAGQINMHLLDDPDAYDVEKNLAVLGAFATLEEINVPEFSITNASIQAQAMINSMPDDIRLWTLANLAQNWFENQTGIDILKFEGRDESSDFAIIGKLSTTAQAMPNGDFDFTSKNLAERFSPFLDQTSQDVVFGMQSEDGSNYQSYSIRHGVVMAGNLPLISLAPLR